MQIGRLWWWGERAHGVPAVETGHFGGPSGLLMLVLLTLGGQLVDQDHVLRLQACQRVLEVDLGIGMG